MKLLIVFSTLLFATITAAVPATRGRDKKDLINEKIDEESLVKYKSKHDIVSILLPVNSLNLNKNKINHCEKDTCVTFFFVEADIDEAGKRNYQGLYVSKNYEVTKILENGRDVAASADDSEQVFFASSDGLYEYKSDTNEAVKYGSLTDSIIGIAKANASDIIYILTQDHELYKVTDAGNTKTKVNEVVNAQEIVLDYTNNVYFYAQDKKPYVLTAAGLRLIEGLPSNLTKVNFIRPPIYLKDGVLSIIDNSMYVLFANGSSVTSKHDVQSETMLTAMAIESIFLQYYAHNKKIYEYNIIFLVIKDIFRQLRQKFTNTFSAIM